MLRSHLVGSRQTVRDVTSLMNSRSFSRSRSRLCWQKRAISCQAGGAVDVAEVVRTVLLGFRCAQASVVACVVELPHLRFGQFAAVRRLNALGKDMDVCAGGFQRAHDGVRRCDDLAVPLACKQCG
jgi:hypothetical protein